MHLDADSTSWVESFIQKVDISIDVIAREASIIQQTIRLGQSTNTSNFLGQLSCIIDAASMIKSYQQQYQNRIKNHLQELRDENEFLKQDIKNGKKIARKACQSLSQCERNIQKLINDQMVSENQNTMDHESKKKGKEDKITNKIISKEKHHTEIVRNNTNRFESDSKIIHWSFFEALQQVIWSIFTIRHNLTSMALDSETSSDNTPNDKTLIGNIPKEMSNLNEFNSSSGFIEKSSIQREVSPRSEKKSSSANEEIIPMNSNSIVHEISTAELPSNIDTQSNSSDDQEVNLKVVTPDPQFTSLTIASQKPLTHYWTQNIISNKKLKEINPASLSPVHQRILTLSPTSSIPSTFFIPSKGAKSPQKGHKQYQVNTRSLSPQKNTLKISSQDISLPQLNHFKNIKPSNSQLQLKLGNIVNHDTISGGKIRNLVFPLKSNDESLSLSTQPLNPNENVHFVTDNITNEDQIPSGFRVNLNQPNAIVVNKSKRKSKIIPNIQDLTYPSKKY